MDGANTLCDAEMRLITINGQTIMLEGDFENLNMTNEFLNEMLLVNNSKMDISENCGGELNENLYINGVKETNDEPTKVEISIQGDNNQLETIQIGIEEAKALGLHFYGRKNEDEPNSWNCILNGVEETELKDGEGKVSSNEDELCKLKLQSVPVVSVGYVNKDSENLFSVNEETKMNNTSESMSDFSFNPDKIEKFEKVVQEDSCDSLPAIGHLEGFQIPTTEEGVLLPATVNAKMADGSYQTITLVPQVLNGAVTYTVHFSNLAKDELDKNLNNTLKEIEERNNGLDISNKEVGDNKSYLVEELLNSVQSVKKNEVKNVFQNSVQKLNDNKSQSSSCNNSLNDDSVLKINKDVNFVGTGSNKPVNFMLQNELPIDAKIDNLISENENVISSCKKVKYGKNCKLTVPDIPIQGVSKLIKSNIVKAKKVKFKNKGVKLFNDDLNKKKVKMSLLKPNNDHKLNLASSKGLEITKNNNSNAITHMNLNGRLEYPNLKAIDETATPVSYLKVKSPPAAKQPYFNVLPYPKEKIIPVEKQILPLNCDLEQAKNLISLQKFLETQKLQLKIQPIVPNGNKVINIRPKPIVSEDVKILKANANTNHLISKSKDVQVVSDVAGDTNTLKTQENNSSKNSYQENLNVKDVLLGDGKLNCMTFLKSQNSESSINEEKDVNADGTGKLNGIFIKNNPEYFSPKIKDGKVDEHPLGSSENPIQLVQTGHTFHSRQPLSETQLRQIASILQKQKFDSPNIKKNSIFDPKTNTRIVYRVVYPEDVELKDADKSSVDGIIKKKRGRHKTKIINGEDELQKKSSPLPRGPGRPKKAAASNNVEDEVFEEEIEDSTPKKKIPRTRSGRLSRPPRYMVKDYKRLHNSESSDKNFNGNYASEEAQQPTYQNGNKIPEDNNDNIAELPFETNLLPGLRPQPRSKRNFKPEYRCPTCQKIYLGHTRMMWHLNKFPDHCNVEKYKENYYRKRTETKARRAARRLNMCDMTHKIKQVLHSMTKDELTSLCGPMLADALSIWDFLLLRVNFLKNSKRDEVDALLHELILLLEKLTKIAEDIFLPVFTKEAEKDEDCVEIDRMEVAIALGLPVGFYKINNDNLNLLRLPLNNNGQKKQDCDEVDKGSDSKPEECFFQNAEESNSFEEKSNPWKDDKAEKKREENSFWLESKGEDGVPWHPAEDSIKTLSTKFEPNLSTKLLESSNDSIDDGKYEEPVQLIDLDSNSKDVDQSDSSANMSESSQKKLVKDSPEICEITREKSEEMEAEEKPLWNENSAEKELWTESSAGRVKWTKGSDIVQPKSTTELWTNENSEISVAGEKSAPHLWNENSNLTSSGKVDETNSEFLDSLLSEPTSNEFLGNGGGGFLTENISLMNSKSERLKPSETVVEPKEKIEWRNNEDGNNFLRVWDSAKNPSWSKEESILSEGLPERVPGVRTAGRLTSTPETNDNISFSMPNRRNSISDFSNINLESANLEMILPPAKILIKDCLKNDDNKFGIKESSFLENSENFKIKNWEGEAAKTDFSSANVNSEDLMKMALESLTSQHEVINVPPTSFDSAMGILNQGQEPGNLNLFSASETDALDFNLSLPEHLLRTNFAPANFQTTCAPSFQNTVSPSFLSTTNNIFGTTSTLSNSIKFDQFDTNFSSSKKSKALDDVIEFFDAKSSFGGYEGANESTNMNNFSFESGPNMGNGYLVTESLDSSSEPAKKKKSRLKKPVQKRVSKAVKKAKLKKAVDYPKTNTIESIINEALFDSCASNAKPLQLENSSPNRNSTISNGNENYSLPIISESLDEVENLDFLSQD